MHNNESSSTPRETDYPNLPCASLTANYGLPKKKLPNSTKPANKTSVNTSKPYLQNKNWTIQL